MILLKFFLLVCLYIDFFQCPPVQPAKKLEESDEEFNKLLNSVDYASYLSEVMSELHKDEKFSKTINTAKSSDSVSEALNIVSPNIRTKLDELKRLEIIRLNKLEKEASKRKSNKYHPHEMPIPPIKSVDISHLDDINPESFSPEDLKRLIDRTTEIFNQIDKRNDENYKMYEMEKEAKKRAELERTYSDAKILEDAQNKWLEEQKSKHSKHKMINEPGSIEQLKSVWQNEDQMSEDSFNPKTFFYLHDVNGDGNLDVAELETLMQKELDKAYDPNDNATDVIERYHEMSRMRKKFLEHVDLDKNHLISLEEFMQWTKSGEAVKNNEWKTQEELENNYSKEEFDQFYQDYLHRHPELHQPPIHNPPTTPAQPLSTQAK